MYLIVKKYGIFETRFTEVCQPSFDRKASFGWLTGDINELRQLDLFDSEEEAVSHLENYLSGHYFILPVYIKH